MANENGAPGAAKRRESLELFLRFSAVGTIGFLVDVAVLYLALGIGFGRYSGRAVSYVCASTSTWALNRRFTFHTRKSSRWVREWARFFVTNAAGGASNYLIYAALVAASPFVDRYKFIGVAAGSIVGLAINFNLSRFVVFRGADTPADTPAEALADTLTDTLAEPRAESAAGAATGDRPSLPR